MAKYGINLLLWSGSFNNEALPLIKKVADFGFDGVEIPIFDPAQVDIKATNKALKSAGLEVTTCAILGDDRDIISDDKAIRERKEVY